MGVHCASFECGFSTIAKPPWRPDANQYVRPYSYQEAADALVFFQNATAAELRNAHNTSVLSTAPLLMPVPVPNALLVPLRRPRVASSHSARPTPGSREWPFTFDEEDDEEDDVFETDSRTSWKIEST
ncbi:hypothetical protein DL765_001402 [Monosporascus sp. GIB2]|nr:hypothetical protein DL765_001402 [Monosporascus sp. GIB2]